MYFSFLTLPLGCMPLQEKLTWAAENGFSAAELACWPRMKEEDRRFSDLDILHITGGDISSANRLLAETGMKISLLACYDNNLDADLERRQFVNSYTRKCIDVAAEIGADAVGTFIGRNAHKTVLENIEDFKQVFIPLVEHAEHKKVKLLFENCPQFGAVHPELVGNIGFSPELWEKLFKIIQSDFFGLNFDPAHLHWQLIDCVAAARDFTPHIKHMHAKDVQLFPEKLGRYGIKNRMLGNTLAGYWQYRLAGKGDIPWQELLHTLAAGGYAGAVSLEHTLVKPDGKELQIQNDFLTLKKYLSPFLS